MASTHGARIATGATKACAPRRTCRGKWWARRSRPLRGVANHSGIRRRLVSERRRSRLGALPRRLLGRGRRMGTDVGGQRAVGIRAVPLRPLGVHLRPLGLVSGRHTSLAPSGRRRWSRGTAARVGESPLVAAAGRSTAGCRSAGASRITPAGVDARPTAGRASTGPTGSNVNERPSAPPTRHVNLAVPGALSAVPATSLVGAGP